MESRNKSITHGMTKTRFYRIWVEIKKRCSNPNAISYPRYGGRGITICDSWLKFENFRDDMYDNYLKYELEKYSVKGLV